MMLLKDVLYKVNLNAVIGDTNVTVNALQFDSRKIEQNDVFIAIKGTVVDGHDYIIQRQLKPEARVDVVKYLSELNV